MRVDALAIAGSYNALWFYQVTRTRLLRPGLIIAVITWTLVIAVGTSDVRVAIAIAIAIAHEIVAGEILVVNLGDVHITRGLVILCNNTP